MARSSSWARRASTAAALRVSAQDRTGVSGSPSASSARKLCQKQEKPIARIDPASGPARSSTSSIASTATARSVPGSPSTPPSGVVRNL